MASKAWQQTLCSLLAREAANGWSQAREALEYVAILLNRFYKTCSKRSMSAEHVAALRSYVIYFWANYNNAAGTTQHKQELHHEFLLVLPVTNLPKYFIAVATTVAFA